MSRRVAQPQSPQPCTPQRTPPPAEWHNPHSRLIASFFSASVLIIAIVAVLGLITHWDTITDTSPPVDGSPPDYYADLELPKGEESTEAEIKKQFRHLSKQYHPDHNPNDPAIRTKYMRISKAYEVLADRKKRKVYDLMGIEGLQSLDRGNQGQQFDPFEAFFGSGRSHLKKGNSRRIQMNLPLQDFYTGKVVERQMTKQKICRHCKGTGALTKDDIKTCPHCHGQGTVLHQRYLGPGFVQQFHTECEHCRGQGKTIDRKCEVCRGKGVIKAQHTITVELEPGTPEGNTFVFEMESDETPGILPGDIVVTVSSDRHPYFSRSGDDVLLGMRVSLRDALVGFSTTIDHLDGHQVVISRQEPTPPGYVQHLPKEGMPIFGQPGDFGEMLVTYEVIFPEVLTEHQREELRLLLKDAQY